MTMPNNVKPKTTCSLTLRHANNYVMILLWLFLSCTTSHVVTGNTWNYAVYFDPSEEPDRNPFGEGFTPKGPREWDEVNFYGGFLSFPTVDYSDNICSTATEFSLNPPTTDHQQSPIEVEDGPYWACNDRHKTHNFGGTSCDYKFSSTPYGLMARFHCGKNPFMDMSRTTTEWIMDYIELKTPAEHVIGTGDYKPGNFRQYDGELKMVHKGTQNDNADHTGRIAVISILLDAQSNAPDEPELEKLIVRWEAAQQSIYNRCNLRYNDRRCRLEQKNRRKDRGRNNIRRLSDEQVNTNDVAHSTEEEENIHYGHDHDNQSSFEGHIEDLLEGFYDDDEDGDFLPYWMGRGGRSSNTTFVDESRELLQQKDDNNRRRRLQNRRDDRNAFRPYKLIRKTGTEHYYGYDGSMTVPPCAETVWYRILRQPLVISTNQLQRINDLIAQHTECWNGCDNCELATVGKRREDGTCHVDVNRPLQYTDDVHHVTDCVEWHVDDSV